MCRFNIYNCQEKSKLNIRDIINRFDKNKVWEVMSGITGDNFIYMIAFNDDEKMTMIDQLLDTGRIKGVGEHFNVA